MGAAYYAAKFNPPDTMTIKQKMARCGSEEHPKGMVK
jgi:hypothetical protein